MPDYMLKGPNDQSFKLSVPEGTSEADIGQHISTFADRLSASGEPENIEDRRGESISLTDEFKNAWNNNWRDQKEGWRRLGIDFDAIGLPRSRPHYSRDPENMRSTLARDAGFYDIPHAKDPLTSGGPLAGKDDVLK